MQAGQLGKLHSELSKIASLDFSNLGNFKGLASAISQATTAAKNLSTVTSKIKNPVANQNNTNPNNGNGNNANPNQGNNPSNNPSRQNVNKLSEATKDIQKNLSDASSVISIFDSKLGGAVGGASRLLGTVSKVHPAILAAGAAVGILAKVWGEVKKTAEGLYNTVKKIGSAVLSRIKGKIDKIASSIKGIVKQVTRVISNRLLREGFNIIQEGIAEGIKNVAQGYEYANKVMSKYATQNMYLKNVLGAMIIPILAQTYKAYETLTNAIIRASDFMNQFFSVLAGKSTYIKAKKQYVDYANTIDKSSSKAKKSTQKLLGAFDQLNDITETASSANEDDFTKYFTEANIETDVDGFSRN